MSRPSAPSMPTERQIREAYEVVTALHPGARIVRVGPEGVVFDYPSREGRGAADAAAWEGKPFSRAG